MTTRRHFLKNSLLSSSLLLPEGLRKGAGLFPVNNDSETHRPLFLATWNYGINANRKAWEVLHAKGTITDAVEEGVKIIEADPESRSVGLNGYPDREGIVTLDASIMNGNGSCGSVCFVRQVRHPSVNSSGIGRLSGGQFVIFC